MIGRRHKRIARDRELGLVFSWRVRETSSRRKALAMAVVLGLSAWVGGMVTVRVAPTSVPLAHKSKAENAIRPASNL